MTQSSLISPMWREHLKAESMRLTSAVPMIIADTYDIGLRKKSGGVVD